MRTYSRNAPNWLDGTTLRINNEPPQPVLLKADDEKLNMVHVFIVDLQRITLVRSLELNLNQLPRVELVAIEVHRTAVTAGRERIAVADMLKLSQRIWGRLPVQSRRCKLKCSR